MKSLLPILFSLFCISGLTQNEFNIWYFGDFAGIDFNSGAPVAISNSQMTAIEGCASICDASGNLLFYTNGREVWDSQHTQIQTGLNGNASGTQTAIIVPRPSFPNNYYIFNTPAFTANSFYSEVDMTQNGGLGSMIAVNSSLGSSMTEKQSAIGHANGVDYWVIQKQGGNNAFYSYPVTAAGIGTAVISSVGGTHASGSSYGELAISDDGTRVAVCNRQPNNVEVFDFDNATGILSNPFILTITTGSLYGLEFSPNNRVLYASCWNSPNIYQYDLAAGGSGAVQSSMITLVGTHNHNSLQLGPDAKLYVAAITQNAIDVINFPDVVGFGCNFVEGAVPITGVCRHGLPQHISGFHRSNSILADDHCWGDTTLFDLSDPVGVDSVHWSFGDPGSGAANFSDSVPTSHWYASPGNYMVSAILFISTDMDTIFKDLTIFPAPEFTLNTRDNTCVSTSLAEVIHVLGFQPYVYEWSTGDTTQSVPAITAGNHSVTVTDTTGCKDSTLFIINNSVPSPPFDTCTWVGTQNVDWFNACNWDVQTVPDSSCVVLIPGGTIFHPVIGLDTADCKRLIVHRFNGGHLFINTNLGGYLRKRP